MSRWLLAGELVAFRRDAPVPDEVRPLMDSFPLRGPELVLRDPALGTDNWIRPMSTRGADPVRFLMCVTGATPPMARYYLPSPDDRGFLAEPGRYEGHWRQSVDERSDLPWPEPCPDWADRNAFIAQLHRVEERAARVAYRGLSDCRLCGRRNGHEGLRRGCWEWPAGFRHYVVDHRVRPTDAFIELVRAADAGQPLRK